MIPLTILNVVLLILAMALVVYGRYQNVKFIRDIDKVNKEYEKEIEEIRKDYYNKTNKRP